MEGSSRLGLPCAGPALRVWAPPLQPQLRQVRVAAPGSVIWTLESSPYPAKIELGNVTHRVDSERVSVKGYKSVPRAVAAVLDVAVDGVWTRVEVRYGVEEALGLRAPLGLALADDYMVVAGPTYGEDGASLLSAMYWNATGGCLDRGGEAPGDYLVGVRPLPFFRIIIATLVALAAATALPPRRLGSVG